MRCPFARRRLISISLSPASRPAACSGFGRPRTTTVVRGRPNAQQAAGREGGLKLMEIKRLREKGHRITLLDETRFWRLTAKR